MEKKSLIGRVIATEKVPTTIDSFCFWTNKNLILNPFDVVVVSHIGGSKTFAVIEEISHITDSASFLSNFISSDFGDVNATEATHRIGMNYVKANVVGNDKNIFIPVQSNAEVYLATKEEVTFALGLNEIKNPLVCGYLEMYENVENCEKITLPVNIDSAFLIGPEGAHLNISGISGLAAKTSYAMFLMKAIQDKQLKRELDDGVAFVIFNVKGRDLLALDEENTFDGDKVAEKDTKSRYAMLGIDPVPFQHVTYLYPYMNEGQVNSHVDPDLFTHQLDLKKAFKYKFLYEQDRDTLDLLFSNIDDPTQTMDSILNFIMTGQGKFDGIRDWSDFLNQVNEMGQAGNSSQNKEITVHSWRKFNRLVNKAIHKNGLFASRVVPSKQEVRIADKIRALEKDQVYVIDIARLNSDMQAYVFGNTIREIYDLQLGTNIDEDNPNRPSKIIVFMDELNKFASTDVPKNSPILRQILDIAERGRSLGVILFGAEQFKSALHSRVSGNCSTFAYGRTNAIELSKSDYKYIPQVYKNMMTRLKQGEYIIQNPVFRSLLNVRFPKPLYRQFK